MTKPETDPTAQAGVTITDAMVEAAEAAVYPRHEKGFLLKPLVDAIDMRAALEAAIAAQPAQTTEAVGIKPLVWEPDQRPGGFVAHTVLGDYHVWSHHSARNDCWLTKMAGATQTEGIDRTENEAKSAAQSDHEARIRSTLAPAPPSTGAEPVGWQWRQARGHIWRDPGFGGMRTLEWYQARPGAYVVRFLYAASQEQVSEREAAIEECAKVAETLTGYTGEGTEERNDLYGMFARGARFAKRTIAKNIRSLARPRTTGGQG